MQFSIIEQIILHHDENKIQLLLWAKYCLLRDTKSIIKGNLLQLMSLRYENCDNWSKQLMIPIYYVEHSIKVFFRNYDRYVG